jgi:hypothetical protein
MMKKIAIIGADSRDRMVLTQALSYITGYDIASKTDYAIQAIRYGLHSELSDCKWQELFVYVLSSFSERIVIEQHYDQYISNGGVLYELAMVRALLKAQTGSKRKLKEQAAMLAGSERVITEYAKRQYDALVYIETGLEKENAFSIELDSCIRNLIMEYGSVYRFRKESILADMLESISSEMKIPSVVSSQTALKKAQDETLK